MKTNRQSYNLPYIIILITALLLQACSSFHENENDTDNDIYKFEIVEVPVTSDIMFSETENAINDEINDFGIRTLSNIVTAKPDENIAFSPISAITSLSIFHNTKTNVYGTGLNMGALITYDNFEDVNSTCNKLLRFLPYSKNNNCNINIANSVWLPVVVGPQSDFKKFINSQFYAELYHFNPNVAINENTFPERVRKWVEIKTNGEIPNYRVSGDDASAVVYNVTYFKGEWLNKFETAKTETAIFYSPTGDISTDMMNGDFSNIQWCETNKWQSFALPFDGNYDMIFVLPNQNNYLNDVISAFDPVNRTDCTSVDLTLRMPKFSIDNNIDLSAYFDEDLGATVKQITKLEVNENGAKAVAVTEVTDGILPIKKNLTLDHPFLYALVNRKTGSAIMMGTVCTF